MNKVILMGRLTKDPELRYTNTNNVPVCSFRLAVDRRFSKQNDEEQADFFPVVAWSKNAEFCSNYFQKGKKVVVVGRLQTRTWDDNEGKRNYITEVVAEETYFAESKKVENSYNNDYGSKDTNEQPSQGFNPVDDDDELPF
ncbi:single-stranded DNA-binding protein [Herbivorax sp. ANBcel31]|uniref:single-stranded DNA-binding protein n=1 Tax=Herbivorax sp. ANBcel31 TaxID=3069754 RepID=UPI0027B3F5A0|nr:single-stranded DNA-binding protein [Herbivorax sp. ANBcel31]MDQ2085139.1 single-stranded DNA-binding protein [Herbivorax sp. ANBcel31]